MTFLTGEKPSDTKLNANNALKTSSVKRVQYLMRPDALNEATSSDGHESRRCTAPRDAEIAQQSSSRTTRTSVRTGRRI